MAMATRMDTFYSRLNKMTDLYRRKYNSNLQVLCDQYDYKFNSIVCPRLFFILPFQ